MKTPVSRFEVLAGGFLLVVGGITLAALLASARRTSLLDVFRERTTLTAVADDGYGATVGSPVKVHDVEVGSVTDVSLIADGAASGKPVRIRMRLAPDAASFLGDKTVAVIIRPPFGSGMPPFGTSSIELRSAGTGTLPKSATIEARGEDSMVATVAKMRGDVQAIREQFVDTLKNVSGTIENLHVVTEQLAHGRGFAGKLLSDEGTADSLAAMIKDARAATAQLRDVAGDVRQTMSGAPALVKGATETSDEARKLLAKMDKAMEALPVIVASAERTLAAAEDLTQNLRAASTSAPELARKVDSSLDETGRLVEAAQQNFLLRATLPERATLRTGADVRPSVAPDAGTK